MNHQAIATYMFFAFLIGVLVTPALLFFINVRLFWPGERKGERKKDNPSSPGIFPLGPPPLVTPSIINGLYDRIHQRWNFNTWITHYPLDYSKDKKIAFTVYLREHSQENYTWTEPMVEIRDKSLKKVLETCLPSADMPEVFDLKPLVLKPPL